MVLRTLVHFSAKRVPLIRFRKGGYAQSAAPGSAAATNQASGPTTTSNKGSYAIEDWELPPRYWRKPIDPVELEYINNGGPV